MADRERHEEHDRLATLLADHSPRSFGPGFASAVIERVQDSEAAYARDLAGQFRWLAAAAGLAAIVLATYSLVGSSSRPDQSALEAVLGLEPVTIEAAYRVELPLGSASGGGGSP